MLKPLLAATILLAGCVSGNAQGSKPFSKVNGVPIFKTGGIFMLREMKREGLPVYLGAEGPELVTTEVLRQAAVAKGMDKSPEAKQAIQLRVEETLATICRGRISEQAPAPTQEELVEAWDWVEAHALTQYELYRIWTKDLDEALQRRKALLEGKPSPTRGLGAEQPFWAIVDDEDLAPKERLYLKQMITIGKRSVSEPYADGTGYTLLEFTTRTRKVDPLLRTPLDDYALEEVSKEEPVSFQQEFIPVFHLRKVMERLRSAAKQPPMPTSGGPWPVPERKAQEAIDQRLLAEEARRLGLDREDWVVAGLAVVRARTLARAHFEQQLTADPITEAALRKAFERTEGAPMAFLVQSYQFRTEAEASAALASLKKAPEAGLPDAQGSQVWLNLKDLMPEAVSVIRKLDRDAWCEKPLIEPTLRAFFILRWTDLRPATGFDKALEARRDALLRELKQQRWAAFVDTARKAAKIEPLN